jgi:hypothetical protein
MHARKGGQNGAGNGLFVGFEGVNSDDKGLRCIMTRVHDKMGLKDVKIGISA